MVNIGTVVSIVDPREYPALLEETAAHMFRNAELAFWDTGREGWDEESGSALAEYYRDLAQQLLDLAAEIQKGK